ncbi:MAG: DUF5009 domain-containing protein [Candidatus Hinthialibacter antarcticus]|nr:DUF5009 domain-containing protein [Candidatus Hinthialibacter antarcticus]
MNDAPAPKATQRLTSLDAYRGAIMISLISVGFGFHTAFANHPFLGFLSRHTEHVPWQGFVYWDLIQPAFMFMVGVAMPFAYAKRLSMGDSHNKILFHAFRRSINLFLVAAVFSSIHAGTPTYTLVNVLPQIAFGYMATMFVLHKSFRFQGAVALLILFVYGTAWALYPYCGEGGPWAMSYENMGGDFDLWAMGRHNSGYWMSLNAIPSASTIIAGAMCGKLLASNQSHAKVMKIFAASSIALIVAGLILSLWVPIIKRILSPSFALYSTGWSILFLMVFYWIIDVLGYKKWTFFLIVIGMNSIAAYVVFQLFRGWIDNSIMVFSRPVIDALGIYGDVLQAFLVLAAQWYIFYFFYQKKVFFKV